MNALYQQMIIDHSRSPYGAGMPVHGSYAKGSNPLCGDQIACGVHIHDQTIQSIVHQTSGCSLSIASASLMAKAIEGQSLSKFQELYDSFIQQATTDRSFEGKFKCLSGVKDFPMRIKCITFPWHAVAQAIKQHSYPLFLEKDAIEYWSDQVLRQMGVGVELDFKQIGCYGWKFDASILTLPKLDYESFAYSGWDLYIKQEIIAQITGTRVACSSKDAFEQKLVYHHPKAQSQCGCGESIFINE